MKKIEQLYDRYIVKSIWTYVLFIIVCFSLILVSITATKVPVLETFEGNIEGNRVIINEIIDYSVSNIYVYKTRSDNLNKYSISKTDVIENRYTVLYIKNADSYEKMDGIVHIDMEKTQASLLFVILGIEKKYA